MRYVKYTNAYGKEIFFDNIIWLCENMTLSGSAAKYSSQSLAFANGQYSADYFLDPLPLKFDFALRDNDSSGILRRHAADVFSCVLPGTITVYTDITEYHITAHLTAVPEFRRDGIRRWKWSANFIADEPLWKRGELINSLTLSDYYTTIFNPCSVNIPITATFYTATTFHNGALSYGFSLSHFPDGVTSVTVDTENFSVVDQSGNNVNYLLVSNTQIGDVFLKPGNNSIFNAYGTPTVQWWERTAIVI